MNRVLIADNDDSTRELIGLAIGQFLDCKYDIANSTFQTVKNVVLNDYKLLIINIHMQGINGSKIVDSLKNLSPDTVIIAITSSGNPEFKHAVLQSGASHILTNPFSIKQLLDAAMPYL